MVDELIWMANALSTDCNTVTPSLATLLGTAIARIQL
jgi:hypothetical protein